jgi:hypothetical protein
MLLPKHKLHFPPTPSSPTRARGALVALLLAMGLACESGSHGKDASPATSQRLAQVSVRLDLPSGGAPSVSVLAFRAEAIDMSASDVLGAVDPLVSPAPESACELRDVAGTARMVRAQGGTLNLQELGGVALQVAQGEQGDKAESLRPAPRVYPPLADVVSGVIAEAGPLDLGQIPEALTLVVATRDDQHAALNLTLPGALSVSDSSESPLDARATMSMKGDLVLRVSGPPRTFLEIRPFGAPSAIACAVTTGGWVVVPHDLLAKLVASAGRAPVSFEAVWRESRVVQAGSETTRVSFEARSSAVLELRP